MERKKSVQTATAHGSLLTAPEGETMERKKTVQTGAEDSSAVPDPTWSDIARFQATVYDYYRAHPRRMPWRETVDPYHILVSEVMLQQTGVERVAGKFQEFLAAFPDISALARAPLAQVLATWQGLGYNRRALNLKHMAGQIMEEFDGVFPRSPANLLKLKGVGPSTAGAILAFAFNVPFVFIETNIRTVFIHFFFTGQSRVRDVQILPLIDRSLDRENPREWYWALMDYGVMLKKNGYDMNGRSMHYQKQSPFRGSTRQIRGSILKALVSCPGLAHVEIARKTGFPLERVRECAEKLVEEGFIVSEEGLYRISR